MKDILFSSCRQSDQSWLLFDAVSDHFLLIIINPQNYFPQHNLQLANFPTRSYWTPLLTIAGTVIIIFFLNSNVPLFIIELSILISIKQVKEGFISFGFWRKCNWVFFIFIYWFWIQTHLSWGGFVNFNFFHSIVHHCLITVSDCASLLHYPLVFEITGFVCFN